MGVKFCVRTFCIRKKAASSTFIIIIISFGSGIVPVDGVGRISYGHFLYHASPFCSITCIIFPQSIFLHLILAFSTFVSVFLFLYYHSLQISKPSLSHCHLLSSKHVRTTAYCLLQPSYLKTLLCPTYPSTPRCFFDLITSHHTSLESKLFLFFSKLPSLYLYSTKYDFWRLATGWVFR